MKQLGVTKYYVKRNFYYSPHSNLYETVAPLLRSQGFDVEPTSGDYKWGEFEPGLQFDYDIDSFRDMPFRNIVHIMHNMAMKFRVSKAGLFNPWLSVEPNHIADNVIHLTERWREGSRVDWNAVRHSITGSCVFVGFVHEWENFCSKYGEIVYYRTENLLELAQVIAGAKRVYCNQTVSLALSQSMGKEYYLEKKPNKYNVLTRTQNEHLL